MKGLYDLKDLIVQRTWLVMTKKVLAERKAMVLNINTIYSFKEFENILCSRIPLLVFIPLI